MSGYSSLHICTAFDDSPCTVSREHGTVSVKSGDHRIALTLTAEQFDGLARVCMAQAEAMREEAA